MLACWSANDDAASLQQLRDAAKADVVAGSLHDAAKLCIEMARVPSAGDVANVCESRQAA
jgi:hypothetical protein